MRRWIPWIIGMLAIPSVAAAGWQTRNVGGVDTRIYTPDSLSPIGEGRGLMVGLHGCAQTADHLQQHANLELAADDYGLVIALPNVPGGGVIAGCWSYYGPLHSRDGGHAGPVVAMTEALRDDPQYQIDPRQIYLAGFSAGGGEAVVLGCVAPDLFAGVGVAAGPALGTTVNQIGQVGTTAEAASGLCQQLAGGLADDLQTQVAVAFTDTNDFVVAQGYAEINARMIADIVAGGVDAMTPAPIEFAGLPGASPTGMGTVWADSDGPRIAWLVSSGVGHNWPAGSGGAPGFNTYVTGTGLNFAYYLAEFFTEHSRRVGGGGGNPSDDDGGSADDGGDGDGDGDDGGSGDDGGGGDAADGWDPVDDGGEGDDGGPDDGDEGDGMDGGDLPGLEDPRIEPSGCQCRATPWGPSGR